MKSRSPLRPCRMSLLLWFLICFLYVPGCSDQKTTKPAPADTTPPGAILDLSVTTPPGREVILAWHAPGDDGTEGQAASYALRYAADSLTEESWASATPLTAIPLPKPAGDMQSVRFEGLPYGVWHFAIKACDEIPNWSPLSNIARANLGDFDPPGPVTNLIVSYTIAHSATLSWTAPGNDGASGRATEYDLRYAMTAITEETWEAATRVEGVPAPKDAGSSEAFAVTGLENEQTYSFALKTADESHNWSALSNVATALVTDYMPPAQVTDLAVWASDAQSLTVGWTAPGNNGTVGRAVEYDLRYALEEIHEWTWDTAVRVQGLASPDTAGATERFTIAGLQPDQKYYFALKTADEVPNWSNLSNLANGTPSTIPMRRLTNSPSLTQGASSPSWSPDGESILFRAVLDHRVVHPDLPRAGIGRRSRAVDQHRGKEPHPLLGPGWAAVRLCFGSADRTIQGNSGSWTPHPARRLPPARREYESIRVRVVPGWLADRLPQVRHRRPGHRASASFPRGAGRRGL